MLNHVQMKKAFALLLFVIVSAASVFAQSAQLSFSSSTNFTAVEAGFHPIKFQLTSGSNANVDGLLEYVQNNPKYFQVQVNGSELTLNFVEGIHWGVWMKVFGSLGVSQIEIREANQNVVVEPMEFLRYFHLIGQ
jgi:hypothetical protein